MSEGRVLALTDHIYDAACGGTSWAAVGKSLTGLLRAQSASLMVGDYAAGRAELLYCADIPRDAVVSYHKHYRSVDLWTNRAAAAVARDGPSAQPRVWTSGHLVPDAEFLRSEFYVDFGRRLGLRYVVGTVVPLGAAGMMPLGLHRPDGAAPFTAADQQLLESLVPHLRRALQLRHQFAAAAPALPPGLAALDALAMGVLVVDADSQVLLANAAAEMMAKADLGLMLRRPRVGGHGDKTVLSACYRADSAALQALVKATASGGSGGAVRLRSEDGAATLAALIAPLPRRLSDAARASPGASRTRRSSFCAISRPARRRPGRSSCATSSASPGPRWRSPALWREAPPRRRWRPRAASARRPCERRCAPSSPRRGRRTCATSSACWRAFKS